MLRYQIRKAAGARGGYDSLVGWLPSGSSARKQDAIDRCASKPYAADAAASGELDPDLKVALEKLLKGHNVAIKAILAAYDFLGVEIEKKDAVWVVRVDSHDATITAEDRSGRKYSPSDYDLASVRLPFIYQEAYEAREAREAPYKAVRLAIRVRIGKALGLVELPEDAKKSKAWRIENGFEAPPRPKERRNGDWTCAFCWQVHAVDKSVLLVHHGYKRPGHGSIVGDCTGVGGLPWERSPEGAKLSLEDNMARSDYYADRVLNGCFRLDVEERNPTTGKTETVWIFKDDPRWPEADRKQRLADERVLQALWSDWFCSIPWLRAAIREWKYEETGAAGAPFPTILPGDQAEGRPVAVCFVSQR
jgi:hypothetical protein